MQESLRSAIDHHRRGELAAAEALYAQTIASTPEDAYALRCLASLLSQQGRFDEAIDRLERALALQPNDAAIWNEHGSLLANADRLEQALASFQRATQIDPRLPEPACNFGQVLCFLGRHDEALPWLDRAIAGRPTLPLAHNLRVDALYSMGRHSEVVQACREAFAVGVESAHLRHMSGTSLIVLGQSSEALIAFDRALQLEPRHVDVLNGRGNALHALGRHEAALRAFDQALALKTDNPEALNNRAMALAALQRYSEALEHIDRALKYKPDFADAWNGRGAALDLLNRQDEAVTAFDRAIALNPNHPTALSNRGIVLVKQGSYESGLESLDRALALNSLDSDALNSRGNALGALGRRDEAFASFERALAIRPDFQEALVSYGSWLGRSGRAAEASRILRRAAEIDSGRYPESAGSAFYAAAKCCDWVDYDSQARTLLQRVRAGERAAAPFHLLLIAQSPADQLDCARIWIREKYSNMRGAAPAAAARNRERLRIAYLSPDFRSHPVASQACRLFELHDRSRFETIAVAFGPPAPGDAMRERLERAFDRFLVIPDSTSDREAARQIRDLDVAIAIDLAGYTSDGRPGVLACRPAPVQVSFLGYPGTLGADHIDYLIADRVVVPEEHRAGYSERLVNLPRSFFALDDTRQIAPTPSRRQAGLPDEGFVYSCFNHNYKLTPALFDIWMSVLRQVPGSVLWLSEPARVAADNLQREAQRRGISSERLIFAPRLADPADHLARLRLADLFLDTLPYNAHATACDALWAGLPVLTCLGPTFTGRVAGSLLHALGMPELVVQSLSAYETVACELANDGARLAALRARLSSPETRSGLFDTDRLRRELEWAYGAMWERCVHGESASDFAVPRL